MEEEGEENGQQQGGLDVQDGDKLVGDWVIVRRLGRGAYGEVFHVLHTKIDVEAATKIELLDAEEHVLRIELQVLDRYQALNDAKFMELFDYGATDSFSYIVMTLCGPDLTSLRSKTGPFTDSTLLRVAIRTMIALKSLHEVGYLHRDIKPDNFASTLDGSKVMHVIDFGMVRSYAIEPKDGKPWLIRRKRSHIAFRGTVRYCSISMHHRQEQGRVDDLWSWLYMIVDLRTPVPWRKFDHPEKVCMVKEDTADKKLFGGDPVLSELLPIAEHLRTLAYYDRPKYLFIAETLANAIKGRGFNLLDDYDWEALPDNQNELKDVNEKINAIYQKYNCKRRRSREQTTKKTEEGGWETLMKVAKTEVIPGGKHCLKPRNKKNDIVANEGAALRVKAEVKPIYDGEGPKEAKEAVPNKEAGAPKESAPPKESGPPKEAGTLKEKETKGDKQQNNEEKTKEETTTTHTTPKKSKKKKKEGPKTARLTKEQMKSDQSKMGQAGKPDSSHLVKLKANNGSNTPNSKPDTNKKK